MKQMSRKKVVGISLSLVLVIGVIVGVTLAYLNKQSQTATNVFAGTDAKVNVGVLEKEKVLENGDNTLEYPGMSEAGVEKKVQIKNINSPDYPTTDTYVRVRLVPIVRYTDGEKAGQIAPVDVDKVDYTFGDKFADKWAKEPTGGETYYYYKKALAPDEATTDLITGVSYSGDIPENAAFELQVLTEGISKVQYDAAEDKPWNYNF